MMTVIHAVTVVYLLYLAVQNFRDAQRLREDCADAYMAFGAITDELEGKVSDEDIERFLDNMSAAVRGDKRPHDLLPFPREWKK